jgi:predicted phosphodiesterase
MKIAIASDLHLEFQMISLNNTEDADVLILAGDICVVKHLSKYLDFFKECAEQFKHVIYVVGNHEHYNYQFKYTVKDLKEALSIWQNIHVLDNETFELDNKVFIGSTLWTDMNKEDPMTIVAAQHGMPDFKIITYHDTDGSIHKYTPQQSVKEYNKNIQYIEHVLANSKDKDCIVVTHHTPSDKSCHPRYKHEKEMNGAFHNTLDYLMELTDNIKLWVHGHTHDEFHYTVGVTPVVCNPRGYPKENQHGTFKLKYMEI